MKGPEYITGPINQYQCGLIAHAACLFLCHDGCWLARDSPFGLDELARTIRAGHAAIGPKIKPYLWMPKRPATAIASHTRLLCYGGCQPLPAGKAVCIKG